MIWGSFGPKCFCFSLCARNQDTETFCVFYNGQIPNISAHPGKVCFTCRSSAKWNVLRVKVWQMTPSLVQPSPPTCLGAQEDLSGAFTLKRKHAMLNHLLHKETENRCCWLKKGLHKGLLGISAKPKLRMALSIIKPTPCRLWSPPCLLLWYFTCKA